MRCAATGAAAMRRRSVGRAAAARTMVVIAAGPGRRSAKSAATAVEISNQTHISFPENGGVITGTRSIGSICMQPAYGHDAHGRTFPSALATVADPDASADPIAARANWRLMKNLLSTFALTEEIVRRDFLRRAPADMRSGASGWRARRGSPPGTGPMRSFRAARRPVCRRPVCARRLFAAAAMARRCWRIWRAAHARRRGSGMAGAGLE